MNINIGKIREFIKQALAEDVGQGDITSTILVAPDEKAIAVIKVKETAVVCGLDIAEEVFRLCSVECGDKREELEFEKIVKDGSEVSAGTIIATVSGRARAILMAERTVLNFLQVLSGTATLTRKFVQEVQKAASKTRVYDTRKTIPNMRYLQKYAVKCGGGWNHRMGLWDMVLVKDNHLQLPDTWAMLSGIKKKLPDKMPVEVEVKNLKELEAVLKEDVDIIMLDNMSIDQLKHAIKQINNKCEIEVSGGINFSNIKEYAKLGVDRLSVGALTHSLKAVDIGMDIVI